MVADSEIETQLQKLEESVTIIHNAMKNSTVSDMGRTCQDIVDESTAVYIFLEGSAEEVIMGSNIDLFDRITTAINSFQTIQEKFNFWMVGETVEIDGVKVNGVTGAGVGGGAMSRGAGASSDNLGAPKQPVEAGMDIDERLITSSMGEGGTPETGEGSKKKSKKERKTPKKDQKKEAAATGVADEGLGSDFAGDWPSWNVEGEGAGTWPGQAEINARGASINEAWPPPVPTEMRQSSAVPAVSGGDGFPDFFEDPRENTHMSNQQGKAAHALKDPIDLGFPPDTVVVDQPHNSKETGSRIRSMNSTIRPSETPAPIHVPDAASSHQASGFGAFPTDLSTNKTAAAGVLVESPGGERGNNTLHQRSTRSPKGGRDGSFHMGPEADYPSLDAPAPWQSPKSLKSKSYDEGGAPGSVNLQMRLPNVTMDMITPDFHKNFQDHLAQALDISSARIRINSVKPVS